MQAVVCCLHELRRRTLEWLGCCHLPSTSSVFRAQLSLTVTFDQFYHLAVSFDIVCGVEVLAHGKLRFAECYAFDTAPKPFTVEFSREWITAVMTGTAVFHGVPQFVQMPAGVHCINGIHDGKYFVQDAPNRPHRPVQLDTST